MAQNIGPLQGAYYSAVPAVDLPKQGGGTARFTDVTPTTAAAADVASGKIFFASDGTQTTGTASGGGSNDFVVTLTWDSNDEVWGPDQSFADIQAAYNAGKTITVDSDWGDTGAAADGFFFSDSGNEYLVYMVYWYDDADLDYTVYTFGENGIDIDESGTYFVPSGTKTITSSGTTDVSAYASAYVAAGTAGTPTATKGAVNNHAISVTPSVTNTTGYITGGTKTGTAVSVAASELVSGSETKTANGTYDVTNLAQIVVNVSGGGGGGPTLLATKSLGTISTSSTSAADSGKNITVTGYNDYDLLLVDVSVDTTTNNRHTSTVSFVILTGTSNVTTKNTYTVGSNKWNSKLGSTGTGSTRQSTSAYGIYANSATVSGSTMTIPFYQRYNSTNTGTINGTYTARVYGVKLYDLIGG